ncbi:hypothetical protein ABI59_05400 [Acidobacteria bacterium Mor1]|nr:hypothetical protein ABI59_05400 [Acidobacteria bacterium Mor1]
MARPARIHPPEEMPSPRPIDCRELERRIAQCASRMIDSSEIAETLDVDCPRPLEAADLVRAMRPYLASN